MAAILDERWSATWVEARAEVTLPSARRAHRRTEPRALNAAAPASAPADVTVHDAPASNHQPKAASEAKIHGATSWSIPRPEKADRVRLNPLFSRVLDIAPIQKKVR